MQTSPQNTTVVILAAGHGKRMLPLTAHTPKPLLKIGELTLIEHHLLRLAEYGFRDIVINVAYLAEMIIDHLGNGSKYGLNIRYSDESASGALETAGGLRNALPLIKSDSLITVNADIWTDFDFRLLLKDLPEFAKLVMYENPSHNLKGDFVLNDDGFLTIPQANTVNRSLTYSGIAIYQRKIIAELDQGKAALGPIFRKLISESKLQGQEFNGVWHDIGTPERLTELRNRYTQ